MVLTCDTMVNGISSEDVNKKHKVKRVNFPGGISEKILDHFERIFKQ